ncbi:MAG: hypothetical protein JO255_04065 [Alphaproteobacteria bacterium]|nr:hypothetical protein [Alphaproteobacteria bacterium]
MSDAYRLEIRSGRIARPEEPTSWEPGPTLNETLAELATTLAGIVGVFVIILAVVHLWS